MRFVFLTLLMFSQQALAASCFIETHAKILVLSNDGDYSKLIKNTNCESKDLARFATFAGEAQGAITDIAFNNSFPNIELRPHKVIFYNLGEQLSLRGILPTEGRIVTAKQLNGTGFVALSSDQRMEFDCATCPSTGDNTLKVTVRDALGSKVATHWVKTEIGIPVKAYVAKSAQNATLQALDATGFETKTIISSHPQTLVNADFPLQFYKLSHAMTPGENLLRANVSPVQLVRPGVQAQLTVRDGNVTLSGTAIPLSYGIWGETIKLKNTRSSRVIMGRVVDHNKVVVEL